MSGKTHMMPEACGGRRAAIRKTPRDIMYQITKLRKPKESMTINKIKILQREKKWKKLFIFYFFLLIVLRRIFSENLKKNRHVSFSNNIFFLIRLKTK